MSCFVKIMFLNFSFIFNKLMNYFISLLLHAVFDNIKADNIVDESILIQSWRHIQCVAVDRWNLSDMVEFSEQDCIMCLLSRKSGHKK